MTTTNDGKMTLPAGTDLEVYRRVIISAGTWIYAGLGVAHDATTNNRTASGDQAVGLLHSLPDTFKLSMATTCNAGDLIYGAANGQGSTTKSGNAIGVAVTGATAIGGYAEVRKLPAGGTSNIWKHNQALGASPCSVAHPFGVKPGCIVQVTKLSDGTVRTLSNILPDATNIVVTVAGSAVDDVLCVMAWPSSDV